MYLICIMDDLFILDGWINIKFNYEYSFFDQSHNFQVLFNLSC
jgi:hypothetical protein